MSLKTTYAIVLLPVLVACYGDSSNSNDEPALFADSIAGEFNIAGPVVNACASNYYTELAGLYDGQIDYTSDDETLSCTWRLDLQITSEYLTDPVNRATCDLTMNVISQSANPEGCSDVGISGDLSEPLKAASNSSVWLSPPWPIELEAVLDFGLPGSDVHPIGVEGAASVIALRFDGLGNIRYPETAVGMWSGVLVKQ